MTDEIRALGPLSWPKHLTYTSGNGQQPVTVPESPVVLEEVAA